MYITSKSSGHVPLVEGGRSNNKRIPNSEAFHEHILYSIAYFSSYQKKVIKALIRARLGVAGHLSIPH